MVEILMDLVDWLEGILGVGIVRINFGLGG
jgi:hypothetical protein